MDSIYKAAYKDYSHEYGYGHKHSKTHYDLKPYNKLSSVTQKPITTIMEYVTSAIQNTFTPEISKDAESTIIPIEHSSMANTTQEATTVVTTAFDSSSNNTLIETGAGMLNETFQGSIDFSPTLSTNFNGNAITQAMDMLTEAVTANLDSSSNNTLIESGMGIRNGTFEGSFDFTPTLSTNFNGNAITRGMEILTEAVRENITSSPMISFTQNNAIGANIPSNVTSFQSNTLATSTSTMESAVTPMIEILNNTATPFDEPESRATATSIVESISTTITQAVENTTSYIQSTVSTTLKEQKDFMTHSKEESHADNSNAGLYVMLSLIMVILILIGLLLLFIYIRYRKYTSYNRRSYDFCQKEQTTQEQEMSSQTITTINNMYDFEEKPQQTEQTTQEQENCSQIVTSPITFSKDLQQSQV